MTLWFWNIASVPEVFLRGVQTILPNVSIGILSDDAHTYRQMVYSNEIFSLDLLLIYLFIY
jgi:hypothetical protein